MMVTARWASWSRQLLLTSLPQLPNGIWQNLTGSKYSTTITNLCVFFHANRKTNMAALATDWLRHFLLLLFNCWTEFNENSREARSQRPLPSLCLLGGSENQDSHPGLQLAETFSTSSLKPGTEFNGNSQEAICQKLQYQVCVFWADWKTRMASPASDWQKQFSTSSLQPLNRISMKLDTKQVLNMSCTILCFSGRSQNQDNCPGNKGGSLYSGAR